MKKKIIWLLVACFIINWYIRTNLITKCTKSDTVCIARSCQAINNKLPKTRAECHVDLNDLKTIRARKYMNLRKNL